MAHALGIIQTVICFYILAFSQHSCCPFPRHTSAPLPTLSPIKQPVLGVCRPESIFRRVAVRVVPVFFAIALLCQVCMQNDAYGIMHTNHAYSSNLHHYAYHPPRHTPRHTHTHPPTHPHTSSPPPTSSPPTTHTAGPHQPLLCRPTAHL